MKKTALIFILGSLFGSVSTWSYVKKKYEKISKEEIDSVKETFSKLTKKSDNEEFSELSKEAGEKEESSPLKKNSEKQKEDYNEYQDIVNYSGYSEPEKKKEVEPVDGPYVISPDECGEYDDYEVLCWTYYADEYLADEDDELVDDIEGTIGYESLRHFGEYEDDVLYVRNDDLNTDYEITLDSRKYADVYNIVDHQQEG